MDITENDTQRQQDSTEDYGVVQELGDCYTSVGNYAEAHKCYEKAAGLGPDAVSYTHLTLPTTPYV